jgi:hypothetical protein
VTEDFEILARCLPLEHRMDLEGLAEMYVFGTLPVERLPAAAADALEAGFDSRSLRQLAGSDGDDPESIRSLFRRALNELGVRLPSPSEAGLSIARRIAGDIARGSVGPYEGARQIWWKIYTRFPQLVELRGFVGYASEYEDDPANREDYSRLIVELSKRLLTGRSG